MKAFLWIFLGGGLGSMLRYAFTLWFINLPLKTFPWPTFLANLLSCFILGLALKKLVYLPPNESIGYWLLITGFCGGFSTFSTFSWEVLTLLKTGFPMMAAVYVMMSLVVGLLFVWIGYR
ncbi:MAG: fluoride efflux transporter CrcB [Saprospiraceae bacterium]